MQALIISPDENKREIAGYIPAKSHVVHRQSAKMADDQLKQALKDPQYKKYILLSGGSANGKTEYMHTFLSEEGREVVVFDGTLPTNVGANIKIRNILKKKKKVCIHAVIPHSLQDAYKAFLARDRKIPDLHFFRTHSGSRETLLYVAQEKREVEIVVNISFFENQEKLTFKQPIFLNRNEIIEYLKDLQYTEEEIEKEVLKNIL